MPNDSTWYLSFSCWETKPSVLIRTVVENSGGEGFTDGASGRTMPILIPKRPLVILVYEVLRPTYFVEVYPLVGLYTLSLFIAVAGLVLNALMNA